MSKELDLLKRIIDECGSTTSSFHISQKLFSDISELIDEPEYKHVCYLYIDENRYEVDHLAHDVSIRIPAYVKEEDLKKVNKHLANQRGNFYEN